MQLVSTIKTLRSLRSPLSALRSWIRNRVRTASQHSLEQSVAFSGGELLFDDVLTVVFLSPENLRLGRRSGFNRYVYINAMGGVTIGDDTRIGPFSAIHSADHRHDDLITPIHAQGHKCSPIVIGNDVWIGAHATILRGCMIPDHCIIGAGAVVDRHLQLVEYDVVRGNPAKVVANRREQMNARSQ